MVLLINVNQQIRIFSMNKFQLNNGKNESNFSLADNIPRIAY